MHRRSRILIAYLCLLVTAVTGKPHQCSLEEYAKALLAQYNLIPAPVAAVQPSPFDFGAAGPRPGRSNDAARTGVPPSAVLDPAAVAVPVTAAGKSQTIPCKATLPQLANGGNDTSSTATVEKLSAYYDQLKGQQEMLARQQHQHQLFEQQQRRQQEFMLVQQQIQQQYLQQQQHALFMLDQLRKNPAFAGQVAAFAGANGTAVSNNAAVAGLPAAVKGSSPADVKEQTIANHVGAAEDCGANKHVGPRQTVTAKVDRSSAAEDDGSEDDQSSSEYDDQTAYDDTEKPAVVKKVYRMVAPAVNADEDSVADAKRRATALRLEVADGCGSKRLVTRQVDERVVQHSSLEIPSEDDDGVSPTLRKLVHGYGAKRHLATRQARFGVDRSSVAPEEPKKFYRTVTEWRE